MDDEVKQARAEKLMMDLLTEATVDGTFSNQDLVDAQEILMFAFELINRFHEEVTGISVN